MINTAINALELIGIGVFNADGTPKGASELIKEIEEKFKTSENLELAMEGITKDGIYMKEIISELKEINNKLIYETGYIAKTGLLTELVNSFGQAITEIDLCIDSLEFLNREFENRIENISLVISKLEGTVNILDVTNNKKCTYSSINLDEIKINTKEVIKKLKSFNEAWNDTKIETTEIDSSVEDKKENEDVKKPTFDEAVLNENIETMRKEIKQIDSWTIHINPIERNKRMYKQEKLHRNI